MFKRCRIKTTKPIIAKPFQAKCLAKYFTDTHHIVLSTDVLSRWNDYPLRRWHSTRRYAEPCHTFVVLYKSKENGFLYIRTFVRSDVPFHEVQQDKNYLPNISETNITQILESRGYYTEKKYKTIIDTLVGCGIPKAVVLGEVLKQLDFKNSYMDEDVSLKILKDGILVSVHGNEKEGFLVL